MKTVEAKEAEAVTAEDIAKLKLECRVYQESGAVPATISLVLPTFNTNKPEYNVVLSNILKEASKLIDDGAIDELVIVDGSRDKNGRPDFEFIKFMLAVCVKHCKTFSNEVHFVKSLPEGKQKAMEGRFDFSVRFLSQLDPLLHKIFLDHRLLTKKEVEFLKKGKGAGLWYSVPVTYGHIICFIDSDIRSFDDYYVASLCKPILDSWDSDAKTRKLNPGVVFTKAIYVRKNETEKGNRFGGRVSRLFMKPIFRIFDKKGVFAGMDEIKYHLSGECAFAIDTLKTIRFSNGYDIETSILCQLWKEYGLDRMAQVDLGVYQHMPGSQKHVLGMLDEIVAAIKYWINEYGLDGISIKELSDKYPREAKGLLDEFHKTALWLGTFNYDKEDRQGDEDLISRFRRRMEESWESAEEPKLLKAWKELEEKADSEKGYSYQNLKVTLRKRINKFTSNIILSSIFVDRSDDIINKYSSI